MSQLKDNSFVTDQAMQDAHDLADEVEVGTRHPAGLSAYLIPTIALAWSLFQLALPKFLFLDAVQIRTTHLAFAMVLAFLSFPTVKKTKPGSFWSFLSRKDGFGLIDYLLAALGGFVALYLFLNYEALAQRAGALIQQDIIIGVILVVMILDAARRTLGLALPIVALFFTAYAFFGPYMPDLIAFKGVSINRYFDQVTASTEGIFGVPIDVSANIVFLFVLFGALLEKVGGGQYFVNLAFSVMGPFRGGPAKASIFASGCTGLISGSSIANTVTTGTFTIPLMKRVGFPAYKAGAVEVASSTNGQLTPPIMGAAAFIIAEYTQLSYFDVVVAALVPALVSYVGLFYIVHLEACKLDLKGIPREELPNFWKTFLSGTHYLIPLGYLIYQLMVLRVSPQLAAYHAIIALITITVIQEIVMAISRAKVTQTNLLSSIFSGIKSAVVKVGSGLISGGRNMVGIAVATGAAGIIVAVVTMGLGGLINEIVSVISGNNLILLLLITAVACLILGMGLPTTANYIVMAALTAPLIVELGVDAGLVVPLIAAHLFVFYFGILADDTPPVGLAAYAASAIAKSDPIKTGIQGFKYDIRTAILPFMFIFNTEILLIGVDTIAHGLMIFAACCVGMMAFSAAVQGWFKAALKWYETILLLCIALVMFRPELLNELITLPNKYWSYVIGTGVFALLYTKQALLNKPEDRVEQASDYH